LIDRSFEDPQQIQEDSMVDDSIHDDLPDNDPAVQYQVIEEGSNRGKRKLCDTHGYSYTVKVR